MREEKVWLLLKGKLVVIERSVMRKIHAAMVTDTARIESETEV